MNSFRSIPFRRYTAALICIVLCHVAAFAAAGSSTLTLEQQLSEHFAAISLELPVPFATLEPEAKTLACKLQSIEGEIYSFRCQTIVRVPRPLPDCPKGNCEIGRFSPLIWFHADTAQTESGLLKTRAYFVGDFDTSHSTTAAPAKLETALSRALKVEIVTLLEAIALTAPVVEAASLTISEQTHLVNPRRQAVAKHSATAPVPDAAVEPVVEPVAADKAMIQQELVARVEDRFQPESTQPMLAMSPPSGTRSFNIKAMDAGSGIVYYKTRPLQIISSTRAMKFNDGRFEYTKPVANRTSGNFKIEGRKIHDKANGLTWELQGSEFSGFAEAMDYCKAKGMRVPSIWDLLRTTKHREDASFKFKSKSGVSGMHTITSTLVGYTDFEEAEREWESQQFESRLGYCVGGAGKANVEWRCGDNYVLLNLVDRMTNVRVHCVDGGTSRAYF